MKIVFPSILLDVTSEKTAELPASTLQEALKGLVAKYGEAFKEKVLDPSGKPRRQLNFYVNGRNIRFLKLLETPLKEGDEISIIPSVSGG